MLRLREMDLRMQANPGVTRTAVAVAAYAALWFAADFASKAYAAGSGLSVWDVRAALDVVLFFWLGSKWWPLPVALTALRLVVAPGGFLASPLMNVAASVPYELTYALAVMLVERLGLRSRIRTSRDVVLFVGVLVVCAPVIANGLLLVFLKTLGVHFDLVSQALQGAIADATAIIVVVPFLTTLVPWKRALTAEEEPALRGIDRLFIVQLFVLVAVVAAEYLWVKPSGLPFIQFSIVPLAWIAITAGTRGAVVGLLICDIAVSAMHAVLHIPVGSQIEYDGYLIASGLVALLVGVVASERAAYAETLRKSAYYDKVTALPNSLLFEETITENFGRPMSLVLVDVSDVRLINEAIGRATSDEVLNDYAQRLRSAVPRGAVVARIDYDAFAVAIPDTHDPRPIVDALKKLNGAPFSVVDANVYIDATLGAAGFLSVGTVPEALRRAGAALRAAKESVDRTYALHSEAEHVESSLPIVDLYRAVERDEFVPFYQPIYRHDSREGRWSMAGVEALLRWRHPERGLMTPPQFLDLLNRFSIGSQVGWNVLRQTLRNGVAWRRSWPDLQVWVNLSSRQVLDPLATSIIEEALYESGAAADMLVVEVTEQLVSGFDAEIAAFSHSLHAIGVQVAIDDFGTGTSSLSRLRQVPVHILKIDRSFVRQSDFDEKARAVARTVVRLARELGIETLAEGVETEAQAGAMLEAGCSWAQGYVFAHPMPADVFERDYLELQAL